MTRPRSRSGTVSCMTVMELIMNTEANSDARNTAASEAANQPLVARAAKPIMVSAAQAAPPSIIAPSRRNRWMPPISSVPVTDPTPPADSR